MPRSVITIVLLIAVLASATTGCFLGHTARQKHRANVYNTIEWITGMVIATTAVALTASDAGDECGSDGDKEGCGLFVLLPAAGAALGVAIGTPLIIGGLGGYAVNAATGTEPEPTPVPAWTAGPPSSQH